MVDSRYYRITHSFTTIHLFEPISWFPALDIYTDIYTDIYSQPVAVAAAVVKPMTAAACRQGKVRVGMVGGGAPSRAAASGAWSDAVTLPVICRGTPFIHPPSAGNVDNKLQRNINQK